MSFASFSRISRQVTALKTTWTPILYPKTSDYTDRAVGPHRRPAPAMPAIAAVAATVYLVLDIWAIFSGGPTSLVVAPIIMIVVLFLGLNAIARQ
jgi:hypothetical protein